MPTIRVECKYCDNPCGPANYDGDLVCSNCGAEWADARCEIEVSDYELEQERQEQEEYEQWMMTHADDDDPFWD